MTTEKHTNNSTAPNTTKVRKAPHSSITAMNITVNNKSNIVLMADPYKLADALQFAYKGDGTTHLTQLEMAQRDIQQIPEQARAQCHVYAIGGVRLQVSLENTVYAFENNHDEHTHRQNMQGAQALAQQYLVDHHLCE